MIILLKKVTEKTMIALLVGAILSVGTVAGTWALGWLDVITRPWDAHSATIERLDGFEDRQATAIKDAVQPLQDDIIELTEDVQFIVVNTPPLKVVDWSNTAEQIGPCTHEECIVAIEGARTDYGDSCGEVTEAGGEIRINGEPAIPLPYSAEFEPIMLTKVKRTIRIPLDLPSVVTPGEHEWRTWARYESCAGPGEPKVRHSHWYRIITE